MGFFSDWRGSNPRNTSFKKGPRLFGAKSYHYIKKQGGSK